jgi:hypothetical protein
MYIGNGRLKRIWMNKRTRRKEFYEGEIYPTSLNINKIASIKELVIEMTMIPFIAILSQSE